MQRYRYSVRQRLYVLDARTKAHIQRCSDRHGKPLQAAAQKKGVMVAFEAAVAGGIPIVKTMREALVGNDVSRVYGILNGTSNFILTMMQEEGQPYADALAQAQKLGYAEADPTFDVGGFDAAHKLALLTSLVLRTFSHYGLATGEAAHAK